MEEAHKREGTLRHQLEAAEYAVAASERRANKQQRSSLSADPTRLAQLAEENESAEELWTKAETKLSECSKFDVSEWWEYCRSLPQTVKTERRLRALSLRFLRCARHNCGHQGSAEGCFDN